MTVNPIQQQLETGHPQAGFKAAAFQGNSFQGNKGVGSKTAGNVAFGLGGLDAFLKAAPGAIIRTAENSQSTSKFVQDTLSVWAPKFVISRSWAERVEMSFLEFVESALFYFAPAVVGQHLFKQLMLKASPLGKQPGVAKYLAKPLAEAPKALRGKLLPVKAAIVLASAGVLAAEYSLSFVKNLLTENLFKKTKFSSVIGLEDGNIKEGEITPARRKANRRIKQSLGLSAALVAGAVGLAAFGGRFKSLQKPLETALKHFDFSFGKGGHFGLNPSQMRLTILAGVIGYHDAARDRLELAEVFSRVACVVAPYLMFGSQAIQGALATYGSKLGFKGLLNQGEVAQPIEERLLEKVFGKKFFFNNWLRAGRQVKSQSQIEALAKTLPKKAAQNLLRAKKAHFFTSEAIGILGVGLIVTLLNQAWTRLRFRRAKEKEALKNDLQTLRQDLSQVNQPEALQPFNSQPPYQEYQASQPAYQSSTPYYLKPVQESVNQLVRTSPFAVSNPSAMANLAAIAWVSPQPVQGVWQGPGSNPFVYTQVSTPLKQWNYNGSYAQ